MKEPGTRKRGTGTRLAQAGRADAAPFVNPPVIHASTVLFDSVAEMHGGSTRYVYGRRGTPTSAALESALADLDGAAGAVLCPSGLSAMTAAILPFVRHGEDVLLPDSVYGPARSFATILERQFGVQVRYYDPTIGAGIAEMMLPTTTLVYVESPGSLTMEMQDIPAIADAAHANGAVVVADNTWATPLFCRPLDLGVDVAIVAVTKYIGGHADLMMGSVTANERHWPTLKRVHGTLGLCAAPDDIFLALRGLRTLEVRLERHMRSGLAVAEWLSGRPEIARVLHPGLASDPGHTLWQRDMTGASGLFSIILQGWTDERTAIFLDALTLFGLGYSWGGFESLAIHGDREMVRTARPREAEGPLIRLHVGLDDPADLIADLDAAFAAAAA